MHLALTGADQAHALGYTGAGVRIAVVDTGVNRNHPALAGRVIKHLVYIDPARNDLSVDDVIGHGTWVSQIMAGQPVGQWPGGVAPGALIVSARIISDDPPEDDGSGQGNEVPPGDSTPAVLGFIHDDLIAQNVRIMNNSWGGLYWSSNQVTAGFVDAYDDFVLDHNGLVVFATGNESSADPSDSAALPSQGAAAASILERGWLAVAALDSNQPDRLAGYSNACGIAMNYCLVAPGNVIVTGHDDVVGDPSYWIVGGTSFAAPQVSGAAALVWQAFPYFSNDLVRQTLLGTATDLGVAGVDAVFGHGLLDAGAAVGGPARFDWGTVSVAFDGITSTWSNAITGAGGLTKNGTGRLVLEGSLGYAGNTQVLGGTLAPVFSLPGNAVVGVQGTLDLFNSGVVGDLANQGQVSVRGGDAHAVGGDYVQSSNGTLAVEVGASLDVAGSAQIAGDLHVLGQVEGYVHQQTEDVLVAAAGLTGTFGNLTAAPGVFLTASLNYDANKAWLDITQLAITQAALNFTTTSFAAAGRVDDAFGLINRQLGAAPGVDAPDGGTVSDEFIAAAGAIQHAPTIAAAEASMASLTGELHAASAAMTLETIDAGGRAFTARLDALLDDPRARGAWNQTLSLHGGLSQAGFSNVGFDMDGWLLGNDTRLGAHGFLGTAFGRSDGNSRLHGSADRSLGRSTEAALYGGVIHEHGYLHARLAIGRFDQRVDRRLLLGTHYRGVSTDYAGDFSEAYAEAGYRFDWGDVRITPYLGSQYAHIASDGFRELGADGFGLKAQANRSDRWQAIAGIRAAHDWRLDSGQQLGLAAHAQWRQTLDSSGNRIDASFTGIDQWQPLTGIGLADSSGLVGVGLFAPLSPSSTLRIDYDYRFGEFGQTRTLLAQYRFDF